MPHVALQVLSGAGKEPNPSADASERDGVARALGIRVDDFSVGFGPPLKSWSLPDFNVTLRALPFVRDGDFITSRGPGTSLQFALALVDALYGREKADELAAQMLVAYPS